MWGGGRAAGYRLRTLCDGEWLERGQVPVTEGIPKSIFVAALALGAVGLAYLVYSNPEYFTNQSYLGGLLLLELLATAVWMYRQFLFPLLVLVFLLAGVNLPVGSVWTAARWVILAVGAFVGVVVMIKKRTHHF